MRSELYQTLITRGCSQTQAARLESRFNALGGDGIRLFVPGRIELVGKHTDYAGGSSLTIAASRGFCAVARPIEEDVLRIVDTGRDLVAQIPLGAAAGTGSASGSEPGSGATTGRPAAESASWTTYPTSVVRRVLFNIPAARRGAEIVLDNDLPRAAGMSSSSALITCIFLAWAHAAEWIYSPLLQEAVSTNGDLADYLASIENGCDFKSLKGQAGVGTRGGSQDHTAIVRSKAGRIRRFRYIQGELEGDWAWPSGYAPVVFSSGVRAKKTGGAQQAYNAASDLVSGLNEAWNSLGSPAANIGSLNADELNELGKVVGGDLLNRLNAFCQESTAVEAASWALDKDDVGAFGHAIKASQAAAEAFLGNQVPQTSALCRMAKEFGAVSGTSFGAGFGGSVWALVPDGDKGRCIGGTLASYAREFSERAHGFVEEAGPGAFFLDGRSLI